ncbi:hypothetical protein FACS1894172_12600 [Spirochaetia bacterium]|nr:hypothetical protein FACS1894172_12600 [Spirochaetia bacterium]
MADTNDFFQNGSRWLRVDFHLHTRADKEFKYNGEPNSFVKDYIDALKKAEINLGVITNHNKFDKDEYKALCEKAHKENICLLPGVELSVSDGANGIHTLVVFSDEWLKERQDYINQFLNVAFEGKTPVQYENENGRSSLNLIDTIKKLEGYQKEFFLVFAHVEQNNGLWNELNGGRLQELGQNEYFKRWTLGFQKVNTHDERTKVKQWLGDWYPAEVEGSDPKKIDDIGNGKKCFIKLGAFTFDAVKYALVDFENRIKKDCPEYQHSYIQKIMFQGGTLNGKIIHFSPELNTLIGIRGSGKSSIIEVLRYVLEIPFSVDLDPSDKKYKEGDQDYKERLVQFTMGSGGKVIISAINRFGQVYEIHRVAKESHSSVYINGQLSFGISIRETILQKPLYFGQKDLSDTGANFEKKLIEKLLDTQLNDVRKRIEDQKNIVSETITRLQKIENVVEQVAELKQTRADIEHHLTFYTDHGLEEKLQKQLDFDTDIRIIQKGNSLTQNFVSDVREVIANHEDELRNFSKGYQSNQNKALFEQYFSIYEKIISNLDVIKSSNESSAKVTMQLHDKQKEIINIQRGLVDEFAEIERNLAEELKNENTVNISSDEFLKLKTKLAQTVQSLELLSKQGDLKDTVSQELTKKLNTLNELWFEEFQIIQKAINALFDKDSALQVMPLYKEDKKSFGEFLEKIFKGSRIKDVTFKSIVDKYADFIDIYNVIETADQKIFGSNYGVFKEYFMKNLKSLLTYQVPNLFEIKYQGKELKRHSLGQRASALILFLLSQKDSDVIIIDQPEDDLDNQTIYEDVIKMIRNLKPKIQFILATHNPNIPVLGDAEQILACNFEDDKVNIESGSIDKPQQQKTIIDIMEGGKEAFTRRKEIYQSWKH